MANFTFQGSVVDASGEPLAGEIVTVYRKSTLRDYDARKPTATTDASGGYVLGFTWNDIETGDFEVVVTDSSSAELGRSVVLFGLGEGKYQVDVVTGEQAYRGRSEFRRVARVVEPLAWDAGSPIAAAALALADVDYLANKAQFSASVITTFIHAHRLADLTTGTISADAFYGMLREGLSPELGELLAQGPVVQRAALERAITRNLIDDPGSLALDAIIAALDALAIDVAVWSDPINGDRSKFRVMIDSADRDAAEGAESIQRAFLAKYTAHEGDLDSFWAAVITDPALGQDVHDTYKWSLQIQALSNGHQPLIDALQAKRNDAMDPISRFEDLPTIDVEGWKTLINGGIGVPDSIPSEWDQNDRVQRYAETIARLVSDAVPTRVVHERIKRDAAELDGATDLDTFFTQNSGFDLRGEVFQRYLAANPTALDAVPTTDSRRDSCADNLAALQRLSYVAPRGSTYDTIKPLYMAGIRSAADIDAIGPVAFVRRFAADFGAGDLGKVRARAVYDRASHVYGMTVALLSKYAPAFNKVSPGVVSKATLPSSAPDLEALFGAMDYCGCEHCRSVFSPGAYMVDLLQFLRQQPGTDTDALSDLQARRPDLTKIDLSCANANTPLPYIDLVNELLETRVSQVPAPGDDHWQTTWAAQELALRPEHRHAGAYDQLIAAAYPWHLPFDLHRSEADLYLDELRVARHTLLETFNPSVDAPALARAQLGLSESMAAALTGGQGFSTLDSWDGKNAAALTSIALVLETSGHSFEELEVILRTSFVGDGLSMSFAAFPNDCDLELASITGLTDPHLERWHRFVRLQRALGLRAHELDVALRTLAPTPGSLDGAFLQRLGAAKVIGESLELEGLGLYELWSDIDVATPPEDPRGPSRYASLFLRRALLPDPEGSNFALDQSGELSTTALPMSDDARLSVVMAALGASSGEISLLVEWLSAAGMAADTTTTLTILSAAKRRITLARALGVSLAGLRRLITLTGLEPFHDAASVVDMTGLQRTLDFLDAAQLVLDSAFSVEALDYILFHEAPGVPGVELDPKASIALLERLDSQLAGLSERYAIGSDPTGARLRDALAEYLPPTSPADPAADVARLDALMAIIAGTSSADDNGQNTTIAAELGTFLADVSATQVVLVGAGQEDDRALRFQHVLDQLLPWLEARARRATTIQLLSESLGLTTEIGERLLVDLMEGAGATPLIETFEAGGNLDANGDPVAASAEGLVRLDKASALVIGHGFDADDLTYLYGPDAPEPCPWLHVDDLRASQPTGLSFESWARLTAVARARTRLPEQRDTLEALRDISLVDEVDGVLAERGGWRADDVNALRVLHGFTALTDFADEAAFLTLADALELLERVGVSASMAVTLAAGEASAGEVDTLRLSLRSRHNDASWASTGKALRDRLRERQRRALVVYLLANGDGETSFADENELYAHYLLDVEMSTCATTSRIKLALSSIQLFIQRVFLNLEALIEFDADAAVQYRWMKNYRVWEANRKVFLYPENFVEPELRSDKSPLYAALEAALAQDEPSEKLTERAFLDYLGGLESVAKPEVMGLVRERESQANVDRLHVLARTRGKPHRWLYRTREYRRFWKPWVELPVEIEGDHALPVVFNGRLYVLWPSFRLLGDQLTGVESGGDTIGQAGAGVLEIGLNWMERRFDEWSPTRSCPGFFVAEQTFHEWQVATFKANVRLATREVKNAATGQPALEITVRKSTNNAMAAHDSIPGSGGSAKHYYLNLGRFVLEVTQDDVDAQSIAEIADASELAAWSFEFNGHVNVGQSFWSVSDSPDKLRLETREGRWPRREQSVTLFSEPPMGYRLIFAQNERVGLVQDTGFFFQDRWRSLFLQPRDIHLAGNWTPGDADPGDIEAAPFLQLGGLKEDSPQINLASKTPDPERGLLVHDQLQVKAQWYAGDGGMFTPHKVAKGGWAPAQLEALTLVEKDLATKIYNTPASKQAPRSSLPWQGKRFSAVIFEHPYAERFVGQVRAHGVAGLLSPTDDQDPSGTLARQQLDDEVFSAQRYNPNKIDPPWPRADVDFSPGGSYSVYNWELFFHAPLLLAKRLSTSQRFEEADDWLRKIFDPTASAGEAPARYWKIRPFFESAQPPGIHELLLLLHYDGSDEEILAAREAFEHQIWQWRRNPFDPHLIAGLRDGAYQRAVVMAYLDNLIAWGDSLFARDTIESINEATQLYILAQNILGPRPVLVDVHGGPSPRNFEELEAGGLDAFSNAVVELENYTLGSLAHTDLMQYDAEGGVSEALSSARVPHSWYFCVPPNSELLSYWDTVADRLSKIRRCQNLQGIERKLALFQPPLDPMALVSAAALGGDFTSALASVSGRAPKHRFHLLLAKALELASEVRSLGSTLLQSLEKQDAAALAQLHAAQEPLVLTRVRAVRELQITQAEQLVEALDRAIETSQARRDHYQARMNEGMILEESAQRMASKRAFGSSKEALTYQRAAKYLAMVPDLQIGIQGYASSPQLTTSFGGSFMSRMASADAGLLQTQSSIDNMDAGMSGTNAAFVRRIEEWDLQVTLASRELDHLEAQKAAALTQVEVAKAELAAHEKRLADAEAVDAFMRGRYTNDQLYEWMVRQIKQVYKQAYNLAFRMALGAEQAYRFELQRDDSFIGYQYWDQAHAGLLAGDLLVQDLRRMDAAYLDNQEREYELTKVVSLATVDPYALAVLRETGSCYFTVPEWVYDLDHPGQIRRRIKSVSVAMPAVAGPHVGGGCTLTLESSKMRKQTGGGYTEAVDDPRFIYRYGQVERIATSSGRDSTGLFEPSLEGPRYLPFEGAGAISTWRVDLPADFRQFDYESIGDLLLTIRYTAREGGSTQAQAALGSLASISAAQTYLGQQSGGAGAAMMLRASVDFADAWYAFLREEHGDATRSFTMSLDASRLPRVFAERANLEVSGLRLILASSGPAAMNASLSLPGGGAAVAANFSTSTELGGHMLASWDGVDSPGSFTLSVDESAVANAGLGVSYDDTHTRFDETKVRELVVVVFFRDPS